MKRLLVALLAALCMTGGSMAVQAQAGALGLSHSEERCSTTF
jgi:hypothetical protein